MKLITSTLIFLCLLCTLFAIPATATSNDKLPSKDEVNSFILGMKNSSSSEIINNVKENHPTWKADLLKCSTCTGNQEAIALYYANSSASNGYGSIYFKDGKIVSPSEVSGYTTTESYKGELEENDNSTNQSSNNSEEQNIEVIQYNTTTDEHTYAAFSDLVDKYDGDCEYSSDNITALCSYFTKLGWSANVQYCVAVNTSDEGMRYIVMGV